MIGSYLAVLLLQVIWHGFLPAPAGNQNWLLVLVAALPLLVPLRGILKKIMSSMTWGGYLLVLYFVVGIMEAWSNPAQRASALAQVSLVLVYVTFLVMIARRGR